MKIVEALKCLVWRTVCWVTKSNSRASGCFLKKFKFELFCLTYRKTNAFHNSSGTPPVLACIEDIFCYHFILINTNFPDGSYALHLLCKQEHHDYNLYSILYLSHCIWSPPCSFFWLPLFSCVNVCVWEQLLSTQGSTVNLSFSLLKSDKRALWDLVLFFTKGNLVY